MVSRGVTLNDNHRIPAIDRAIDLLDVLARTPGATITGISETLGIPRSTVYRIANSLEARAIAVRDADGGLHLGPQLLRLASAVTRGVDIVSMARPVMERLAAEYFVTVKLSVLDDGAALVVAVIESPKSYSITTQVGSRFPMHAGAASKVLLANADPDLQETFLGGQLRAVTDQTIVDAKAVRALLPAIRAAGFAEDHSEYVPGINAVAAPVFGPDGRCVGAMSVPYLSSLPAKDSMALRDGVMRAAASLTRQIGGYGPTSAMESVK